MANKELPDTIQSGVDELKKILAGKDEELSGCPGLNVAYGRAYSAVGNPDMCHVLGLKPRMIDTKQYRKIALFFYKNPDFYESLKEYVGGN